MAKSDKPGTNQSVQESPFGGHFQSIVDWILENRKASHSADVRYKLGLQDKTYTRWKTGSGFRARSWDGCRAKCVNLGVPENLLTPIDRLVREKQGPVDGMSVVSKARPFVLAPSNAAPKLCYLAIDIPSQGSSIEEFTIIGELRFARATERVDKMRVSIGVKRVSISTLEANCTKRLRSMYRHPASADGDGAANSIIPGQSDGILLGDILGGETLAAFQGIPDCEDLPTVEVTVELISHSDLDVQLEETKSGRSKSQDALARNWIAKRKMEDADGTYVLSRAVVRWRRP